jgi:DNA-binding CsgD family transcriptional regulator
MKENLTPRQEEIFNMLINGISPKEIAYNMRITYNTMLFHQKRLYRKLDIHNIPELIAKYSPEVKNRAVKKTALKSKTITIRKSVLFGSYGILLGLLTTAAILLFIR